MDGRQVTIWHNNIGRPIELWPAGVTPDGHEYPAQVYEGCSGISPYRTGTDEFAERFASDVDRYGHAAVVNNDGPIRAHREHDDVRWAESRFREGSMCAYYENGEAFGGRRTLGGRNGIAVDEGET